MRVLNREAVWEKIDYNPFDSQLGIHDSTARFKIPACGRRYGKSKSFAVEALTNKRYNLFMPDVRGWIVGPKYVLGEKEFRYIWDFFMKKMNLKKQIGRGNYAYNVKQGDMFIQLPWGARLDVMSAQHKDTLVGEGLHFLIVSEAAKQDEITWEQYLRATLADYHGWAGFPSTPQGFNWFYELHRLGDPTTPEYNAEYESWNLPSWTNPYVYPGGFEDPEIQLLLQTMPEDAFWQEIGASFRSMVGLIYPEWDDEVHIYEKAFGRDEYVFNPAWDNYVWFDFGYTNQFVALDVQVDSSDNIYIWRERYVSKVTVGRHIAEMKARRQPNGYRIVCGFGDSADPGAVEEISSNFCPVYADPDAKDWARGIREVKRFLKGEDDRSHLFVSKNCPNTIWEFQNYRMKPTSTSGGDKNNAEAAHQYRDHAMDAIRYGIMHLYVLGAARYRLSEVIDIEEFLNPEDQGIFTREQDSIFTMGRTPQW